MRFLVLAVSLCLMLTSGWMALTAGAVEPIERNIIYIPGDAYTCVRSCFSIEL